MIEEPRSTFVPDALAGQVAFITGGGTGIGREIARVLGRHGARVAIASRRREVVEATEERTKVIPRRNASGQAFAKDHPKLRRFRNKIS